MVRCHGRKVCEVMMQSALRAQMWVAITRSSKAGLQAAPKDEICALSARLQL